MNKTKIEWCETMSDTCPTCGGPCTRTEFETANDVGERYESLVKGEVVEEGKAWRQYPGAPWIFSVHGHEDEFDAVLVIRAKQETGGKEC